MQIHRFRALRLNHFRIPALSVSNCLLEIELAPDRRRRFLQTDPVATRRMSETTMAATHSTIESISEPLSPEPDASPLVPRLLAVFRRTWDLGFTSFGGPPVHFQILHRRFVASKPSRRWLDEQTFQELFAICQSLPGPGSTKMLFCITLLHAGISAALMAFFIWSMPAAIVMYGLALGVRQIEDVLPGPVYALLSGLNASTVGVVALAAVQLAEKAITDRMTRILVIWGACAGLCYNALWYFPVLIVAGGLVCGVWDVWAQRAVARLRLKWQKRSQEPGATEEAMPHHITSVEMNDRADPAHGLQKRVVARPEGPHQTHTEASHHGVNEEEPEPSTRPASAPERVSTSKYYTIPIATGIGIIAMTFGE
jgi:chromate transport protein ChrA